MTNSKYHTLLTQLFARCERLKEEMPSVSRMMYLVGLAAEAMEVKNFFETDVLPKTEAMATLDVDMDVDYEEWAKRDWPSLHAKPKTNLYNNPEGYFKPDEDTLLPDAYEDRLLRFFPEPDDTPQSFKAHEQIRMIVALAHAEKLMREEHLENVVIKIITELRKILLFISQNIKKNKTKEQFENLFYEELKKYKLSPEIINVQKEFEDWISDNCYNDPDIEQLEGYRIRTLIELFNTGIFSQEVQDDLLRHRKENEIDFDTLDDASLKEEGWKNYWELRKLYNYSNGDLTIKDPHKTGYFFYKHRRDENALEWRDAFFRCYFKLFHIQRKLTELRKLNSDRIHSLPPNRQSILMKLDSLIEKGEWKSPATMEKITAMIHNVLDVGEVVLSGDEKTKSEDLWKLFEARRNSGLIVTFQNIIGYFRYYNLLPSKGSLKLHRMFLGETNEETYTNIDKGKPNSRQMTGRVRNVLPLLDAYRPQ